MTNIGLCLAAEYFIFTAATHSDESLPKTTFAVENHCFRGIRATLWGTS